MNKIKSVTKPKLYYNKYKYKATLFDENFHLVRYSKNKEQLLEHVSYKKLDNIYFYHNRKLSAVPPNLDILSSFIDWRNSHANDDLLVRVDYSTVSIYGNDLQLLETLADIDSNIEFCQVVIEGHPNILLRNNPKHPFRTYFKSKSLPNGVYEEIGKFLKSYEKIVTPCGSLKRWAFELGYNQTWRRSYLEQSYFVEYDDESTKTILALNFDQYLGKTFKVEQRD